LCRAKRGLLCLSCFPRNSRKKGDHTPIPFTTETLTIKIVTVPREEKLAPQKDGSALVRAQKKNNALTQTLTLSWHLIEKLSPFRLNLRIYEMRRKNTEI